MKLTVVSAVILVVVFVAWPVSAGGSGHEEEEDDTKSWFPLDNLLSLNYYDKSCPNFEKIVDTKVRQWTKSDPSLGPALLRLLFHDCGVTGCDASVLLDHEGSERKSPASKTLRGFELIDDIKSEMEKSCPKLVSCADILAAATRSATYQLGGPYWPNAYGRQARDITGLLETFQSYGLNVLDLVILSGAHTIGKAYCGTIQSRLYNFNATHGTDPSIDPKFADYLRRKCRWAAETVYLDVETPVVFDNQYYINLQKNMGVLTTDQELVKDPRTAPLVQAFPEQPAQMFRHQFAVSMAKLVNVGVITAEDRIGEIRRVCSKSNSRPY
ncbi:PREDICTED: LOW QUALITY PROTEIN: peroxidase 7 [Brassica oleracea var. oleracea]|uniref:LOW QUALITY PROTEIN: peroxidase 7 n=1 Tax=Brassica oleracea var. oleracea TaxID=109376 RepID=UPI0006A6F66A|nr:PREDICTED: LOW QUALITY PROTEIN: peroxidase 7 [Brassica oleracea var. oleracea]